MDLCGHATLATAHVIREYFQDTKWPITFETASGQFFLSIVRWGLYYSQMVLMGGGAGLL